MAEEGRKQNGGHRRERSESQSDFGDGHGIQQQKAEGQARHAVNIDRNQLHPQDLLPTSTQLGDILHGQTSQTMHHDTSIHEYATRSTVESVPEVLASTSRYTRHSKPSEERQNQVKKDKRHVYINNGPTQTHPHVYRRQGRLFVLGFRPMPNHIPLCRAVVPVIGSGDPGLSAGTHGQPYLDVPTETHRIPVREPGSLNPSDQDTMTEFTYPTDRDGRRRKKKKTGKTSRSKAASGARTAHK
jgi:hypothetical protein